MNSHDHHRLEHIREYNSESYSWNGSKTSITEGSG